jgi:phage gpG-like protein
MAVHLRLDFWGDTQINRTLDRFSGVGVDLRPAWGRITTLFLDAERKQFASRGGFGSGGWAPLNPDYARWKAAKAGKPILRRTDELFRSLTSGPAVRTMEPHRLVLGSDVEHGRYHQKGEGVPRRPPVELPESVRRAMVRVLQEALVRAGDR